MKKRLFIAIITIIILIAGIYAGLELLFGSRSLPKLYLDGVDVGYLDSAELKSRIDQVAANFEKNQIKVAYASEVISLSYRELGATAMKDATFQQIYTYGKKGFVLQRWLNIFRAFQEPVDFTLQKELDKEETANVLSNLTKEHALKPQNAVLNITNNEQITMTPAVLGKEADISTAIEQIEKLVAEQQTEGIITIAEVDVEPDITDNDIIEMHITGKIAQVTTNFNAANKERTHNIRIASQKLNDYLIPPGAIFSFNDVVGPRTKEAGYKDALIIVENAFEPGLGGGICQVSSTLYNAALKANLNIKERRRHSLLVTYVPAGLDATVVYGYIDFKFQNNTDGYLWLKSNVSGDAMTVKIFGWKEKAPTVAISRTEKIVQPQVEIINDSNLPAGKEIVVEPGKVGYMVQVVRTVKGLDGKLLSQKTISNDTYPAQKRIVRIGTAEVVAPSPDDEPNQEILSPGDAESEIES